MTELSRKYRKIKSVWIRGLGEFVVSEEARECEQSLGFVREIKECEPQREGVMILKHDGGLSVVRGEVFEIKYGASND